MSNNKQSSVEWLYNKMYEHRGNITIEEYEQAKEMRKAELELAFKGGMALVEAHLYKPIELFDEFYNETFGGNNEQQ